MAIAEETGAGMNIVELEEQLRLARAYADALDNLRMELAEASLGAPDRVQRLISIPPPAGPDRVYSACVHMELRRRLREGTEMAQQSIGAIRREVRRAG